MFKNRKEAGELLSAKLQKYRHKALVFSIPRGGVVVGNILATTLEIHHYILVSKKIPAPNHPELAIGAVAPEGNIVLDKDLISNLGISEEYLGKETERISKEVNERLKKFVSEKTSNRRQDNYFDRRRNRNGGHNKGRNSLSPKQKPRKDNSSRPSSSRRRNTKDSRCRRAGRFRDKQRLSSRRSVL